MTTYEDERKAIVDHLHRLSYSISMSQDGESIQHFRELQDEARQRLSDLDKKEPS